MIESSDLVIAGSWLFAGRSGAHLRDAAVRLSDDRIVEVGAASQLSGSPGRLVMRFPGCTILPGLIDTHVHVMFGTGLRTYEEVMEDSDDVLLLRGVRNCGLHLRAGVTTMRDCGSRNRTGLALRNAAASGYFPSPRLLVSGAPITTAKGHFWWCNGEADGVDGVAERARELLDSGVDFLKIMASGGGTMGTDATRASYSAEEIGAAVRAAHAAGKLTTAHCLSSDSLARATEGGIDQVEHINFLRPDGSYVFDQDIAERIVKRGVVVSPTIQTGFRELEALRARGRLTPEESAARDRLERKLDAKLDFVRRFDELGASIVAGTDAIATFGDFAIGLELLERAGLSPSKVLMAATSTAAVAVGLGDEIGSLEPGRTADVVVIEGDPLVDIRAVGNVVLVVRGGQIEYDAGRALVEAGGEIPFTESDD